MGKDPPLMCPEDTLWGGSFLPLNLVDFVSMNFIHV